MNEFDTGITKPTESRGILRAGSGHLRESEQGTPRPRALIEHNLTRLTALKETIDTRFVELTSGLTEDEEVLVEKALTPTDEPEAKPHGRIETLPPHLQGAARTALKLHQRREQLETRRTCFQEELVPYKKQDFKELRREVETIDYDAMFDHYRTNAAEGGWTGDLLSNQVDSLYRVWQLDRKLVDGELDEFNDINRACRALSQSRDNWKEKGFIPDEVMDDDYYLAPEGTILERRRALVTSVDSLEEDFAQYKKLSSIYHPAIKPGWPFDPALNNVARAIERKGYGDVSLDVDEEDTQTDPRFLEAAERHVANIILEYRINGVLPATEMSEEFRHERLEELARDVNTIDFVGFEPPDGYRAVITTDEVKTFLASMPGDTLAKIDSVINLPPLTDPVDPTKPAIKHVGSTVPFLDEENNHIGTDIEIHRPPYVPDTTNEDEYDEARVEYINTLYHEAGHSLHVGMSLDDMRYWEEVMEADPTAITAYVEHARTVDEKKGKVEDVAETFGIFRQVPAALLMLSESRFKFMMDYHEKHMHPEAWKGFAVGTYLSIADRMTQWEEKRITREDIHEIFHPPAWTTQ